MFRKLLLQSRSLFECRTRGYDEIALDLAMLVGGVLIGLVIVWGSLAFWTYVSP